MELSLPPEQGLSLLEIINLDFPSIREVYDSLAQFIQAEAEEVQKKYRQERNEYQKEYKRGRAWLHDVRVKNTRNGVSIEWFHYKRRYGDLCLSEGIRSEGQLKVPAKNFKSCSAIERKFIKAAEDEFAKLRQLTQHVSKMSEGMCAISQMKLPGLSEKNFNADYVTTNRHDEHGCGYDCNCELPCEEYIDSWKNNIYS